MSYFESARTLKRSSRYLLDKEGCIDDFSEERFLPRGYGQWNRLLKKYRVSPAFLNKYAETYFGLEQYMILVSYQSLSPEYTETALRRINEKVWLSFARHQVLSEAFIRRHKDDINLLELSPLTLANLSVEFIREFQDRLNWCQLVYRQDLPIGFFREFKDKIHWPCLNKSYLTLDFIREFQHQVNWGSVSGDVKLPLEFIEEFADKINWKRLSESQQLPEEFIRKYQERVSWNHILIYQEQLSEAFMQEFKHKATQSWATIQKERES